MIAIDSGEMNRLRQRLREAADGIDDASPRMPGAGAFGPAILAEAAASFESAMRRETRMLQERWLALESGVEGTMGDMDEVETAVMLVVEGLTGRLQ